MTSIGPNKGSLICEWLGVMEYAEAERVQRNYARERAAGRRSDTLLLLEHPHVITLGRSAREKDILVSEEQLKEHRVMTHRCDRGGQVTYHGPGQLIGYLIMNIQDLKLRVPQFVALVEEGLRLWFQSIGIDVERRCGLPGLWCQGAKIASLGFHISRGITRHGFSVNINPDLAYFDWIIPCGARIRTTSIEEILSRTIDISLAASAVASYLDQIFSSVSAAVSSSSSASKVLEGDSCSGLSSSSSGISSSSPTS